MSSENVEAFKRAVDAFARRDLDAVLAEYDPEIEWYPGMAGLLAGETMVYRGHDGIRQLIDYLDETFSEVAFEFPEYRDFGERMLAIGTIRARGRESGIETVSPVAYVIDAKGGKATRVKAYLNAEEALAAIDRPA
jgi:ketosteroid isomerase-like protein